MAKKPVAKPEGELRQWDIVPPVKKPAKPGKDVELKEVSE